MRQVAACNNGKSEWNQYSMIYAFSSNSYKKDGQYECEVANTIKRKQKSSLYLPRVAAKNWIILVLKYMN